MRLQFLFRGKGSSRPNKHAIQGLIYKSLQGTNLSDLHDRKHAKSFTFSDWFFVNGGATFHLSSSDAELIDTVLSYYSERIGLEFLDYTLEWVQKYEVKKTRILRTGSPIVLADKEDKYLSFKRKTLDLTRFDQLIREKAILRYREYTGDATFTLKQPLFEELELRREVPVPVKIGGKKFLVIGSTWNKLVLRKDLNFRDFYAWLMEEGIGEKRSLGFGYLQPFRVGGKHR